MTMHHVRVWHPQFIINVISKFLMIALPFTHGQYGCTWMLAAVKACQDSDRATLDPHAELITYIKSPLELTDNVVGWWGVSFQLLCSLEFIYVSISSTTSHNTRRFLVWLAITWLYKVLPLLQSVPSQVAG